MSTPTQSQGEQYRETIAGATVVTKYVRSILAQLDISTIEGIPNLPTHQKAAKEQSNKWLQEIWPLIINTTADIIDYANTFQSGYDELVKLIPKLRDGDKVAKDEANKVLEDIFLANIKNVEKNSSSTSVSVTAFHSDFEGLYQNFLTDFTKVDTKIRADNTTVDDLTKEKEGYQKTANIREHEAILAGLAIPGIALVTYATAETGIGLIAGGIVIAGDLIALSVILAEYAKAMRKVYDLTGEITNLKAEVTELHAIEDQISGLQDNTLKVKVFSSNFAEGWSKLANSMEALIKEIQQSTPEEASYKITRELATANENWGVILQQAKNLQPNGGQLEVKNYATYEEMLTALDKQAAGANV